MRTALPIDSGEGFIEADVPPPERLKERRAEEGRKGPDRQSTEANA